MFDSPQSCLDYYAVQSQIETAAILLIIAVGVLLAASLLFRIVFKNNPVGVATIFGVFVAAMIVAMPLTGAIPAISFGDRGSIETSRFATSTRELCSTAGTEAAPDDPPADVPLVAVTDEDRSQSTAILADFSKTGLVWVFYAPSRTADAMALTKRLGELGVPTDGGESSFSAVKNTKLAGESRVVFVADFEAQATAVASLLESVVGTPAEVEGPYSLARRPIQVQLY